MAIKALSLGGGGGGGGGMGRRAQTYLGQEK